MKLKARLISFTVPCCVLLAQGLMVPVARADYSDKATAVTDYIQREFYDQKAGLYRPAAPVDPKVLPYDFMWANGVQFSALVGATRHNPQRYRPILDTFSNSLKRYWDEAAPVPGFDAYFLHPTATTSTTTTMLGLF
jgi:hypothetical protein